MKRAQLFVSCLMAFSLPVLAAEDPHAGHHGMQHHKTAPEDKAATDNSHHQGMDHSMHMKKASKKQADDDADPYIPEPTDEDRTAAFPDLEGMDLRKMMDTPLLSHSLLDQFEWVDTEDGSALNWEAMGWIGKDQQRLWWRTEGERHDGDIENAELQLLYGRPFSRWWDWVAGVRHDFRPNPSQTWLAAGAQGLAPYWFETEATLFLGEGGQTNLRFEVEYEILLTNKLILQPLVELNFFGKNDPDRGIGSGLSEAEAGLRLRYEIRREIAPYIGVGWERVYGETADFAHLMGEAISDTALVAGIRLWY